MLWVNVFTTNLVIPLLTLFHLLKTMEKNELEKTLEDLENPYRPYRVEFPYEIRFTTPQDENITEIIVRTRSEEVRFGRNERDVMLQKGMDNRYGRLTYSKHILNWVRKRLGTMDPRECDLEYVGTPTVSLMGDKEVKEFSEGCLTDE